MSMKTQAAIAAKIDELASAERITKALLSELSRELLVYIPDSNDIGMANRLVAVLTPMNKASALLFFRHFLPWQMDDTESTFTKKDTSEKRTEKKLLSIAEFLADADNDIWTWLEKNVTVEKTDFSLAGNIAKAVELAINGKKESKTTLAAEPISPADILQAVVAAGVSIDDVIDFATSAPVVKEDEKVAA